MALWEEFYIRRSKQTVGVVFDSGAACVAIVLCCGCTYGEVFGDVLLHETDVSSVTWASSLLVSLVLVT